MGEERDPPEAQSALNEDKVRLLGGIARGGVLEVEVAPEEEVDPLRGRGSL